MTYTQEKYLADCEKAKKEYQDAVVADATIYFNKLVRLQHKRQEAVMEELSK